MPSISSYTDDVTTAAEALARARTIRAKFRPMAGRFGLISESNNNSELSSTLRDIVQRAERKYAEAQSENVTLRTRVRELENALAKAEEGNPVLPEIVKIRDVQNAICVAYSIPRSSLLIGTRSRETVKLRHIGFFLSKKFAHQSLPIIGREFGGFDHTSVLHGIRKVEPIWLLVADKIAGKSLVAIAKMMIHAWDAHYAPIEAEKFRLIAERRKEKANAGC